MSRQRRDEGAAGLDVDGVHVFTVLHDCEFSMGGKSHAVTVPTFRVVGWAVS